MQLTQQHLFMAPKSSKINTITRILPIHTRKLCRICPDPTLHQQRTQLPGVGHEVMIPGMENLHHLIETTGQDIEFQYFTWMKKNWPFGDAKPHLKTSRGVIVATWFIPQTEICTTSSWSKLSDTCHGHMQPRFFEVVSCCFSTFPKYMFVKRDHYPPQKKHIHIKKKKNKAHRAISLNNSAPVLRVRWRHFFFQKSRWWQRAARANGVSTNPHQEALWNVKRCASGRFKFGHGNHFRICAKNQQRSSCFYGNVLGLLLPLLYGVYGGCLWCWECVEAIGCLCRDTTRLVHAPPPWMAILQAVGLPRQWLYTYRHTCICKIKWYIL